MSIEPILYKLASTTKKVDCVVTLDIGGMGSNLAITHLCWVCYPHPKAEHFSCGSSQVDDAQEN